jgi:hypothetical protein
VAKVFYRIVFHDPPISDDFLSDEEMGVEPAPDDSPEDRRGMSVWSKLGDARGLAKWQVRSGHRPHTYIAAIPIEEVGPFLIEHSPNAVEPPRSNHYTLWGDPAGLAEIARIVERHPE